MRTPIGIVAVLAILAIAAVAVTGCASAPRDSGRAAAAPASQQAPDAQRTQDLVALTTAQAAQRAQRIALVVSRGSRVVEGAPGTPFTRTTFAVKDVLKGRLPREIVLQVIGGRLGDRVVTSAVPAFTKASRYVLFLGPFPQAVLDVTRVSGPRLHDVLFSIRRDLRTTGGSR
jgi:hypothetical protein